MKAEKHTFSAIIDYDIDETSTLDDIEEYVRRNDINFDKTDPLDGMALFHFSSKEDYQKALNLNGNDFEGNTLLVSIYPFQLNCSLDTLKTFFHKHYSHKYSVITLSGDENIRTIGINPNHFPSFQFVFFYFAVLARRSNYEIEGISLDNLSIRESHVFKYFPIYFPKLERISLLGSNIKDKRPLSNYVVRYTKSESKSDSDSDSDSSEQEESPRGRSYQAQDEDDSSSSGDPEAVSIQYDSLDYPDTHRHNGHHNESDSDDRSNQNDDDSDDRSNQNDDDSDSDDLYYRKPSTDHGHENFHPTINHEVNEQEIHPFIDYYLKKSAQSIDNVTNLYDKNAVFSLTFGKASGSSVLARFFPINRNLQFPKRTQQFIGEQSIIEQLKDIFPDGFNPENPSIQISIVCNQFYKVEIAGNIHMKDSSLYFIRTLIIIGQDHHLLISNDHLFLKINI